MVLALDEAGKDSDLTASKTLLMADTKDLRSRGNVSGLPRYRRIACRCTFKTMTGTALPRLRCCAALAGVLLVSACAETPMGPTVQVMPGPNKSFANFQSDQSTCREFAEQAVRDQARNANLRGLGTAALTTGLGAGLGAAIGGGGGAAIGAAAGALGGGGLGAMRTSNAQNSIQAQYDNAFAQCMYSLGNAVPNTGPMMVQPPVGAAPR